MPATWNHPKLGRFKYDGDRWTANVDAPALDAFKYGADEDGDDDPPPTGKHELGFDADDEDDLPSDEAVAVALAVLANQARLVPMITKALWEDFNGRGPDSGMWWHGDMEQVAEMMDFEENLSPPKGPDDLLRLMGLPNIIVHKEVDGYERPVAEISFAAVFEEEHGVGVLTDGKSVLGTGYSSDVTPFGYDVDSDDDEDDDEDHEDKDDDDDQDKDDQDKDDED